MDLKEVHGPTQVASGSEIAQAYGDHAQATVNVIQTAEVHLTAEVAKALLKERLQLELRPEMKEIFKIISKPRDIGDAMLHAYGSGDVKPSEIPYVAKRAIALDTESLLSKELDMAGALLLRGRAGLGKSREIAQLAEALCVRGWTVYIYDSDQMRLTIPRDLQLGPSRKAVLVVENVHSGGLATEPVELGRWLNEIIEAFSRKLLPADLRVIVSARSEPHHFDRLSFNALSAPWNRFAVYELPEFAQEGLQRILGWLTARRNVPSEATEFPAMLAESDGTPAMLLEKVESAKLRGVPLTLEFWRQMRLSDWSETFPRVCRQTPGAVAVLSAVMLLQSARLSLSVRDVGDVARRLGGIEVENAIRELINNRLIGSDSEALRLFGVAQLATGLREAGFPAPSLQHGWRLVADAIEARPDTRNAGRDLLTLAYACVVGGDAAAGMEVATRAIGSPGEEPNAHFARGLFRLVQNDVAGGKQDLDIAIKLGRWSPDVYFLTGLAGMSLGDAAAAEARFTVAMAAGRDDGAVRLARALARWSAGKVTEAEADLTIAIGNEQAESTTFLARGCLRLARGENLSAVNDFNEAVNRGRDDGLIYLLRGVARRATDGRGAEADLTRAIEHGQTDASVYLVRGSVRAMLGNQASAEQDFTVAISSDAGQPEVLFARGVARLAQGRCEDAEHDFTSALDSGGRNSRIYAMRAAARSLKEDAAGAEQDLTAAIELEGPTVQLLRARAQALWKTNRFAAAREDLALAATLEPPKQSKWLARLAALFKGSN